MKKNCSWVKWVLGCIVAVGSFETTAKARGNMTVVLPSGGVFSLISVPYSNPNRADGLFTFGETKIAEGLPAGSSVFFWNEEKQKWIGGMKSVFGWDPAEANHLLEVGEGFFVRNGGQANVTVTLEGAMPSAASLSQSYASGKWSIVAYPYPVEIKFGDTEIANELPEGSGTMFWNMETQSWRGEEKKLRWNASVSNYVAGWGYSLTYHVIQAGEPFIVKSSGSSGVWTVRHP